MPLEALDRSGDVVEDVSSAAGAVVGTSDATRLDGGGAGAARGAGTGGWRPLPGGRHVEGGVRPSNGGREFAVVDAA